MREFIDDLAGAIYDVFVLLLKGCAYFLAGVLIVTVVLYLLVFIIGFIVG